MKPNFNHLDDEVHIDCLKICRKIESLLEMLNRLSGQEYEISPVNKPSPSEKTANTVRKTK